MKKYIIIFFLFISVSVLAQSSADIQKAKALAKQAGYSESEINAVMQQYQTGGSTSGVQQGGVNQQVVDRSPQRDLNRLSMEEILLMSRLEDVKDSTKRVIFGHEIFKTRNEAFTPNYNMPTPENYKLSSGDEVIIDIWGATTLNVMQSITPEGNIKIENVGPISLKGLTIKEAEQRLRSRLSASYSGLAGNSPNTFLSLSLGNIRTINVNVVGDVKEPNTVNVPSLSNITSALYMTGGPNEIGSVRDIRLYRDSKLIRKFDLYKFIVEGDFSTNERLEEGDIINVNTYNNLVHLTGEVKRPMYYEMIDGETVTDLLKYSSGFSSTAKQDRVFIVRKNGDIKKSYEVSKDKFDKFILQDGDSISVVSNIEFNSNIVTISGAVWHEGSYAISDTLKSLSQLLKLASVRDDAHIDRGLIKRIDENWLPVSTYFSVDDVVNGRSDIDLMRQDSVVVFSLASLEPKSTVRITGEIKKPQEYPYRKGMTVGDLILLAEGYTEAATKAMITVSRRNKNDESLSASDTVAIIHRLNLILNPEDINFALSPFDIVSIRRTPDYKVQQSVIIYGEVVFPGQYTVEKSEVRLSDIIEKAYGFTPSAYPKGAKLTRSLTDEEYQRLEAAYMIASQKVASDSVNFNMDDLKNLDKTFNIVIDIETAVKNPGSYEDMVLREGDVINVPKMTPTVKISGGVLVENLVTYSPKMSYRDYIRQAGGFVKGAHKRKVFVVYMNGSVATKRNGSLKIEPGCEIVVPVKDKSNERKISPAEVLSIATSTASLSTMVITLVNLLNK